MNFILQKMFVVQMKICVGNFESEGCKTYVFDANFHTEENFNKIYHKNPHFIDRFVEAILPPNTEFDDVAEIVTTDKNVNCPAVDIDYYSL